MASNKHRTHTSKGIIAALLGIGLLGGYGTFALWSDSETVSGGTITNGNLDISPTGTPAWKDMSPTGSGWTGADPFTGADATGTAIDDISAFLMVPGDVVQYTANQTIIATGDNMEAVLNVDPGATGIVPVDLTNYVKIAVRVLNSGGTTVATGVAGTPIQLSVPKTDADGDLYTVVVRVGFDSVTPNQVGTTESVDLTALHFTLNQVRA